MQGHEDDKERHHEHDAVLDVPVVGLKARRDLVFYQSFIM
jgi:hypothetical protein